MEESNVNHGTVLTLKMDIGYTAKIRFTITEDGVQPSVTGWTWQLLVKRFPGDRKNLISLTLNNGLAYEIYSDTVLIATLSATQTALEEGEYYWALVRTDLDRKWVEGKMFFNFANPSI